MGILTTLQELEAIIIRVRAGISELGRRRFAIAHELGHWLLHAGVGSYFSAHRKTSATTGTIPSRSRPSIA